MPILQRIRLCAGSLQIGDLTARLADLYGDRVAVRLEEPLEAAGAARLSYRDLHRRTMQFAAALAAAGVKPGERLAIAVSNGIDVLLLSIAAMQLGAAALPLNDRLQPAEIEAILVQSGASTLVLDRAMHQQAFGGGWPLRVAPRVLFHCPKAEVPALPNWLDPAAASLPARDANGRHDDCLILYTSGATGAPRGVVHTSATLLARNRLALLYPARKRELVVVALPLAHIMGLVAVLLPLLAGVPVCVLPKFRPLEVLRTLEWTSASVFCGVPAMYRMMARAGLDGFDLSSMRAWISAADAMPEDLVSEFRRRGRIRIGPWRLPALFVDVYGSVELGGAAMARFWAGRGGAMTGPAALLLPKRRARIRNAEGADLPRGAVGDLWIRSPSAFRGYVADGGAAAASRPSLDRFGDRSGWVRTGDLASRGRFGLVKFVARDGELIKTGGYSVFAAEIERVLAGHVAVAAAAAFGLPDPVKTEIPAAAVALVEGAQIDEAGLLQFLGERLADYKIPRRLFIVPREAIPFTATRKIVRASLARHIAERVAEPQNGDPRD